MDNNKINKDNFYGFKPKHVTEAELHIYVMNLMTDLMRKGMNAATKPKYIKQLEKMMNETEDALTEEILRATIHMLK